jgi:hypothetical protein
MHAYDRNTVSPDGGSRMRNCLLLDRLLLVILFAAPCVSVAQTNSSSWANLSALHTGQKIQVVESNSQKHTGNFESVSDSAISIRVATGEASVPRQDVRSVKLMENRHRMRNLLIGTGIGAGSGAGIGAAAWESSGYLRGKGTGAALGTGLGGLTGLIVGSVWQTHETIYRAGSF